MKLTIDEIIKATDGKIIFNKCNFGKVSISTDSRTIKEDEIFLPLVGENFDGHDYINKALKQGCIGYFTEQNHYDNIKNNYNPTKIIIMVDNTQEAYLKIANYARNKINPKVIAITGSSGKTSTKEIMFSVFVENYKTHKSILNHNNEIGLCETLLSMPEDTEYLIIEMGMRAQGEIDILSKYAQPDIAVITNVGNAHIGRLGSLENIAKAKCEIINHLKKDSTLVAFDDNLIKKNCPKKINTVFYGKNYTILQINEEFIEFSYENTVYKLNTIGEYNVINAVAAIEAAKLAKISTKSIQKGLMNYKAIGDRGKIIKINKNAKIISDCYNANPDSMIASIDSVITTYPDSDITLVLGDMAELGEFDQKIHQDLGVYLSDKAFSRLVTVGEKAKLIAKYIKNKKVKVDSFLDNTKAANFLKKNISDNSVILLKGSRCMKLEEITEELQKVTV